MPPQLVRPAGQQRPLEQPWTDGQAFPQLPQCSSLVCRLAQVPLQQVCPAPQAIPQPPQFCSSPLVSTQTPLQKLWPVGQVQTPFTQV